MNKKNRWRRGLCHCALTLLLLAGLCIPAADADAAWQGRQPDTVQVRLQETENQQTRPQETEPETQTPQTGTQGPETEPETQTPQTETQEPETQAPQPETQEPETQAPQQETEPETQVPQTDAPQTETENQQPSRPEKPHLNETSLKMTRKRTYQLKLKGAQGKVRWKSSNPSVVSVSENGRIKAKKAGTCVITAKCAGKKYRCDVRVYESSKEWRPGAILDMYRPKKDKGKVILAGSSYMERWDTAEKALEPFEVLNMGIAGSKADDWIRLYQKLLVPYKPKAIVLCTGDNNMNAGPDSESGSATAQKVIYLLKQLQKELPDTEIYYVSVAPNPRRWKVWSQMKECNRTVEQYCKTKKRLHFIDMTPHLLKKGALQKKLYCSDRLHLNKKGYKIWGEVIGNRLRQDMQILLRQ